MHTEVKEGNEEDETTRGASLRELQRFFKEHDKDEGYAGLRRIADEDGTAVWTILKETEVTTQLEKRVEERRGEERRHEENFSAQARAARPKPSTEEGVDGEDSDQLQQVLVASNEMQLQMNQMQKDLAALNEGPAVTCTCSIL